MIALGVALNETITGPFAAGVPGEPPDTNTCVVAVALPPAPEAVNTYTVFVAGATALVPLSATLPIPLSIVTVEAPVTAQVSVDDVPGWTDAGLAPNEAITGSVPVTAGAPARVMHPHDSINTDSAANNDLLISSLSSSDSLVSSVFHIWPSISMWEGSDWCRPAAASPN
jgi:hypothetical protein